MNSLRSVSFPVGTACFFILAILTPAIGILLLLPAYTETTMKDTVDYSFAVLQGAAIVFGFLAFFWNRYENERAELRDKTADYSEVNRRYVEFQRLLLETEVMKPGFPSKGLESFCRGTEYPSELIAYDLLFSTCEYAYALYGEVPEDWRRWEDWLILFFRNNSDRCRAAWGIASPYYERRFQEVVQERLKLEGLL